MQIISGKYRGKKLSDANSSGTRPTQGRVKESIFNMLSGYVQNFENSDVAVLDLFAGTGQYGLECYSRWGASVVFVDSDPGAISAIRKNCESINCKAKFLHMDVMTALMSLKNKKINLVFMDPPWGKDQGSMTLEILKFIKQNNMLSSNAVIVCELENTDPNISLHLVDLGFNIREKVYGRAKIILIVPQGTCHTYT